MFRNDYSEVADKNVIKALLRYADEQFVGYGLDEHSKNAEKLILDTFKIKNGEVFFVGGGTQANMLVISYLLKNYEAVIACDSGHINVHETGAVEGSGHKVLTCLNDDGKLKASDIDEIMNKHVDEHMVKPAMVYISLTTETGTLYTKKELLDIRKKCDKYKLTLFIDGARLGVALTIKNGDITPELVSKIADVFYVGGTKNGALFGEAIVFTNKNMCKDFRYHIKNKGAMFAKGYVIAIMFEELFKNNLYFKLASNSNTTAEYIRNGLNKLNIELFGNSNSNQIFVYTDKRLYDLLVNKYGCEYWGEFNNRQVVRIVTSFATTLKECKGLLEDIKRL